MQDSVQETFDATERELIRKKLIRYMKENGSGVPWLAKRIAASHKREPEIPLSTLQRFLAGHSKNEFCVRQCHRFAESLTVSDSIAKLGERLSIFYGDANGRDYTGTYFCVIDADFADSEIIITSDAGFWRVTEKMSSALNHGIYDGVLVCSGDAAVVVLKDRLAGLARNYMLWPENETLHGHGATGRFLPGDTTEVWGTFKISGIEPIEIRLRKT